jgi:flavin reductase (DIM6/NTAB) family NADH-FMN oxidoreductase RutF
MAMPFDDARFRQVMSHFASGVTVVTTEHDGQLYGMTVSSFTSLSLVPPLVLVCIDQRVVSHEALLGAGRFAVNVLERRQEHLSRRFASREPDRFAGVGYHISPLGLPLLEGALATIECRVFSTAPGGDHSIIVGEVLEIAVGEGEPLLYYRSGYHAIK